MVSLSIHMYKGKCKTKKTLTPMLEFGPITLTSFLIDRLIKWIVLKLKIVCISYKISCYKNLVIYPLSLRNYNGYL